MTSFNMGSAMQTLSKGVSTVQGAVNTAGKLAGALNNLSNPAALISAVRSLKLPIGGEISKIGSAASALFAGPDKTNDWRVRLSVPSAFLSANSPILAPIISAGELIFPYTPTIVINNTAVYNDQTITHQNYQFTYYQNSRVEQIQITAPFNVEDADQARYWIAVVHFFRSATKMFTGDDPYQGNPPPLMRLNGYGDHVLDNIPVVVKGFSVDLPQAVNYINTSVSTTVGTNSGSDALSAIAGASSTISQLAGLAGAVGSNKLAGTLGKLGAVGGAIAGAGKILSGGLSAGGIDTTAGGSWVPTQSTLSVTLQPIYSREAVRQFSLTSFVKGDYVGKGYV